MISEQTACHGDLESYSDDQDLYICGGATLLNATFLEHLDGSLLVSESDLATVKLPKLRNITGGVTIYNSEYLVTVSLPLLEHIGGDLDVTYNHDSSTYAGTYALPALRAVGGQVYFYFNYYLGAVSMGSLESVGGQVYFFYSPHYDVAAGQDLDMSSLRSVGDNVYFYHNFYSDRNVDMSSLESIGGYLDISSSPRSSSYQVNSGSYDFSSLATVASFVKIDYNNIGSLRIFESGANASVGTYLSIDNNDDMHESLNMAQLTSVGSYMVIYSNGDLQQLNAPALSSIGGYLQVYDNDALNTLDVSALASLNADGSSGTCTASGESEDLCVYGNDLGGVRTQDTGLT